MNGKNIDQIIGKRLREKRTLLGLSQQNIANEIGITFQQIQKYEKGSNALNAQRLYELSKFFRVKVAYFFEDLEGPSNNSELEKENSDLISDREALEAMKAFKRIKNPNMRKQLANLMRSIAYDEAK